MNEGNVVGALKSAVRAQLSTFFQELGRVASDVASFQGVRVRQGRVRSGLKEVRMETVLCKYVETVLPRLALLLSIVVECTDAPAARILDALTRRLQTSATQPSLQPILNVRHRIPADGRPSSSV